MHVQFRSEQPGPDTICVASTVMTNDTLPYATVSADPGIEIAKQYDLIAFATLTEQWKTMHRKSDPSHKRKSNVGGRHSQR